MDKQQLDGDENVYENEVPVADEPKHDDIIYAQIVPNGQKHETVPSSDMNNDAIIYSELQSVGLGTRTVAPSNDVYANV